MTTRQIPCFYLNVCFDDGSFVHDPNKTRWGFRVAKTQDAVTYSSNVYANVLLSNGRFQTRDPSQKNSIMVAIDPTDRGIPLTRELKNAPFTFVDPEKVLTVFIKYSFDSVLKFYDGGNSYTFSQGDMPAGTPISVVLRGRDVTKIQPNYTVMRPISPIFIEAPRNDEEQRVSMISSIASAASSILPSRPEGCTIS